MNPQYLPQQPPQYGGPQTQGPGYGAPSGNFMQGDNRPSPAGTPGNYGQPVGPGPQRGPPQGFNNPGMYNGDNQQQYPPPMSQQPNNLANQMSGMNIGGPMGQQRPPPQAFPPAPSKPGVDGPGFPPAVNGAPPAQLQQHQPTNFTNGSGPQFPPQPGYQPLSGPSQGQRPTSALGAPMAPQFSQAGPQNGQLPPQQGQIPPQHGQPMPQQGQHQGQFGPGAQSRPASATGHSQPQMGPPPIGPGPNQGQGRPPGGVPPQMGPNAAPSGMPPPTGLSGPQIGSQGSLMRPLGPQMGAPGPQMGPPGPQMGHPGPQMGPPGPQMGHPGPQMGPPGPQMGPQGHQMGPPGPQRGPPGPSMGHGPQLGPPGPQPGSHLGQPPLGQPMRPPVGPPLQQMGYPQSQMPPQMPGQMGQPHPGMYPGQGGATGQPGPYPGPPGPGSQPGYPSPGYQQQQPGQYPGANQPQPVKRLDPEQMPSPIQVMQDDQRNRSGVFVTNQKGLVPPIATTTFTTQDQGNCGPRFMRSTMYNVPATIDMMKQTAVPFGLVISPLAMVFEGEYEPAVANMGTLGPVRCIRCKAYMCPFMQFIDGGRRFHCLFCKATTEVPAEYFQHLDHTGQRVDRYDRPELSLGCFEYVATTDYCRNNTIPKPPAFIFLIDVSYNNVKSGLVNLLCARMKEVIRELPKEMGAERSNMKVGFITYNSSVHFYNIKRCLAQAQMMVVGDVADMFMPLLDGFLEEPSEAEQVIDSLMADIPAMFADTRETETLLAPAIQAGLEALKASECSGKLLVFHSSLPIAEAPGKLKNRDDRKLLGTDKEKTVLEPLVISICECEQGKGRKRKEPSIANYLVPQSNVYNNLGQECVAAGCSVDLFLFNNSYIDVATIGQVSRLSGGEVYKYTYFQADLDGDRLIEDVKHDVSRPIAFDAIMRVRTSTGVRPTDFFGHFFMQNTTDLELGSIDCDKAIALEIKHDDKLTEEDGVYIQVALLYTSVSGQRRLRILNLSLKTCSQMADLYRSCDLDTVVNFFAKQTVSRVLEATPKAIKESLVNRCAQILAAYRKNCASPSSAGQLILPECMKLLPLYINCVLKSDAVAGGSEMSLDDRSFVMQAVMTMDVPSTVAFFYPRLLPLIDLPEESDLLPPQVRCSSEKLMDDCAYLLENGIHMFLWIGLNVPTDWVQDVFGVQSSAQIDIDRTALPQLDNAVSLRTRTLIEAVRTERHRSMRLTLVRQRDKMELVLKHFLVEDRGMDSSASYVDFLCHMHKEIRALLS